MALKGLILWCMVSVVSLPLLSLAFDCSCQFSSCKFYLSHTRLYRDCITSSEMSVFHFRMFFSPSGKVSSERFTFSCFQSAFLHAEVCIALSRGELKVHEPLHLLLSAAVSLLLRHFVKQTSVHCFPLSRHCSRSHLKF